jgi:hypothetical protein
VDQGTVYPNENIVIAGVALGVMGGFGFDVHRLTSNLGGMIFLRPKAHVRHYGSSAGKGHPERRVAL